MKKIIFGIFLLGLVVITLNFMEVFTGVFATEQGVMNNSMMNSEIAVNNSNNNESDHTAKEEAEGKIVWDKIQAKELVCKDLSDDDFGVLGEYFMGQMLGNSHSSMNKMMISMMGEDGEKQAHITMGKRMSDCDAQAVFPKQGTGFMSMMNMMWGGSAQDGINWSPSSKCGSKNNSMMWNFGGSPMGWGFGFFGGILMILWWALIIAGIVFLIRWFLKGRSCGFCNGHNNKDLLEILKERYAKGEIDKKEYDEKKKDLS